MSENRAYRTSDNRRPTTSAESPPLDECPTAGVCPPCREGWGHWNGSEYVPTVESEEARRG